MTSIILSVLLAGQLVVGSCEFLLQGAGRSGTIQWPVVAGEPSVAGNINEVLNYEDIAGEPMFETITIFNAGQHGITGSHFVVNFMDGDYLDISVFVDFVGAYPSTFKSSFLFDPGTGEPVLPEALFLPDRRGELVLLCDSILQENIRIKNDEAPSLYETGEEYHFSERDLNSAGIREEGIVFEYQFDYPHVLLAAEPSGVVHLTWEELNGFLLPGVRRN